MSSFSRSSKSSDCVCCRCGGDGCWALSLERGDGIVMLLGMRGSPSLVEAVRLGNSRRRRKREMNETPWNFQNP